MVLSREEAAAIVEEWTARQRDGKKPPPGARLEAAAECMGNQWSEFGSFDAWFTRIRSLPGRYAARALAAAWMGFDANDRRSTIEWVKREAASNRPQAAMWLAGLLADRDAASADTFVLIVVNALPDPPRQEFLKTLDSALVGSGASSPLERLAMRPSNALLRLWRAIVMDGKMKNVVPAMHVGVLAVGVRLACQVADPMARSTILGVIGDKARSLPVSDWERLVAVASQFPEASGVLTHDRSIEHTDATPRVQAPGEPIQTRPSSLGDTPDGSTKARAAREGAYQPQPSRGAKPAGTGAVTGLPITPSATTSAAPDLADGERGNRPWQATHTTARDTGRADQNALNALMKLIEVHESARHHVEVLDANLRRSEEQVREATQALALAQERCVAVEHRLEEVLGENRVLASRVSDLEAEVTSLQGFGERRFRAGQEQLAAKLARDLSLHFEHLRRFSAAGERTDGEQHLIQLIHGMARDMETHGVNVPWQ